jgi:hypothetical protein
LSARDFYSEAAEVAQKLSQAGLEREAQRILAVIEGGSTGTEILLGLRNAFDAIIKNAGLSDTETIAQMTDLRDQIDAVVE